jgi:NADH-quinone oxidoreductase subunit M
LLLLAATLLIGLKPDLLFNWITPALQSPYFEAVLKGGSP